LNNVLLLNMSYEPLNVCSWKRAMILLLKGKAEQLEHNCKLINNKLPSPTVIRLLYYVRVPYKAIPLTRKNILHRDNYICQYCGRHNSSMTIDHIIPRSRGGKNQWDNVVTACIRCNNLKGNKTPQEAGMNLIENVLTPSNKLRFEITKYREMLQDWSKYLEA